MDSLENLDGKPLTEKSLHKSIGLQRPYILLGCYERITEILIKINKFV